MEGERTFRGALCLVASAFGFAVMGMFVRMADDYGEAIPAFQKSFFRNAVAFVIALALFLRAGGRVSLGEGPAARRWTVLALRAVFGTAGIFGNFYAGRRRSCGD